MPRRYRKLCATILTASAIVLLGPATIARADVTVVTEKITDTEVTGASRDSLSEMGDLTKPVLLTMAYSKGRLRR